MNQTDTLPDGFAVRRPTIDDLDAIWRLTVAYDTPVLGFGDWSTDEVRENLESKRSPAATHHWVVEAEDRLVGWSSSSDRAGGAIDIDWFVDPRLTATEHRAVARTIVDRMYADIDDRLRAASRSTVSLEAGSYRVDTARTSELTSLGFEVARSFYRMARTVSAEEQFAAPAAGVTIRPAGDSEDGRRTVHRILDTAFADHWNHHDRAFDEWWEDHRNHAGADPATWWVADLDGEPVGALIGTNRYAEQNDGYVGSLGLLRAGRGRGVAKALLAHAFAVYRDAGRNRVLLHVDSDSPTGATRLYESVGMTPDLIIDAFACDYSTDSHRS